MEKEWDLYPLGAAPDYQFYYRDLFPGLPAIPRTKIQASNGPQATMTIAGIIFMGLFWSLVFILIGFCFYHVMKDERGK